MERSVGAIGYGDQVVGAECLATSVAMELIAAGAEHLAAGAVRTRADFKKGLAAVFVVFDRKALEERVAGGTGGGGELVFHVTMLL